MVDYGCGWGTMLLACLEQVPAPAAGWQILDLHDSTRPEFDAFDLGHLRERQEWLSRHPDHPERNQIAADGIRHLPAHQP